MDIFKELVGRPTKKSKIIAEKADKAIEDAAKTIEVCRKSYILEPVGATVLENDKILEESQRLCDELNSGDVGLRGSHTPWQPPLKIDNPKEKQ